MKPAPFAYHRPSDKAEAVAMLRDLEGSKVLAGGQSLVAMLNLRYAMPEHLIDVNRVPGLAGITLDGDVLRIGAMTRQCDILANPVVRERAPVIAAALRYVGHLQTRNRGTIGGSLAHMDPAAELVGMASLLEFTIHLESAEGTREVAMADFPLSYMTPDIRTGELLTGVSFRLPASGHGWGFEEFALRHGDFAIVAAAVLVETTPDQRISLARITLTGVDFAPLRLHAAEALLADRVADQPAIDAAAQEAVKIDPITDAMASGAYRKRLAGVLTRRALTSAFARAAAERVMA